MSNSHETLVLLGGGGHAKVCYEIAISMNKWKTIIVLDDNSDNNFFEINGPISDYLDYKDTADFFVSIGSNDVRANFIKKLEEYGCQLTTLIHPSAIISPSANIGLGTVVMPGVIINANSVIGNSVILNTACTVDHDNRIGNFVHVSPGVHLAGNVTVGSFTWVGIGTSVSNNLSISKDSMVGAGSNIVTNLDSKGIYFGNPARIYKL